jgi:zinc transport system substrate-binding protein
LITTYQESDMKLFPFLALAALGMVTTAEAQVPRVVATIKPIHSLVAAVMGDLGTPDLLIEGAGSPHSFSLRPSDAQALEAADMVFLAGHGMELFLNEALGSLATEATVVELVDAPGLELLPIREGGAFEAHAHHEHEHEHEHGEEDHAHADHEAHDEHAHDETDMHFWLDPVNAGRMVDAIAAALAAADPEHAGTYAANAATAQDALTALTDELRSALAGLEGKPFIVFHDAYQYFEHRFGLAVAGSITVIPDSMPGARRIGELQRQIADAGVTCVFAEPQFEPTIITAVTEGSGARAGVLDPQGADLEPGPELYGQLLLNLATGLNECLSGS